MKIILVAGARPNFMKIAPIICAIKSFNQTNHTNQTNLSREMRSLFHWDQTNQRNQKSERIEQRPRGVYKRDVIHNLVASGTLRKMKPSLFGSVRGGDVTEKMIQESKYNLFRKLNNL
jgi:hypothetical protein